MLKTVLELQKVNPVVCEQTCRNQHKTEYVHFWEVHCKCLPHIVLYVNIFVNMLQDTELCHKTYNSHYIL